MVSTKRRASFKVLVMLLGVMLMLFVACFFVGCDSTGGGVVETPTAPTPTECDYKALPNASASFSDSYIQLTLVKSCINVYEVSVTNLTSGLLTVRTCATTSALAKASVTPDCTTIKLKSGGQVYLLFAKIQGAPDNAQIAAKAKYTTPTGYTRTTRTVWNVDLTPTPQHN